MIELNLSVIEARLNAATVAPWNVRHHPAHGMFWVEAPEARIPGGPYGSYATQILSDDGYDTKLADAEFVAHAREDIPALLKELRDRADAIERLRELHRIYVVFEACGHTHSDDDPSSYEIDGIGRVCDEGIKYAVCKHCCIRHGVRSIECLREHTHGFGKPICDTRAVLSVDYESSPTQAPSSAVSLEGDVVASSIKVDEATGRVFRQIDDFKVTGVSINLPAKEST